MNKAIDKVWFDEGRIWIRTLDGDKLSLPLEMFPSLMFASDSQRNDFYLWDNSRSIRWESIDEDIHVSNFYEKEHVDYDNEVNALLSKFPYLDIKGLADYLDMHWTRLAKLRFGVMPATKGIVQEIKNGIMTISREMAEVVKA